MQANSVSIAPEMLNWVIAHIQMNSLPKQILQHIQKNPVYKVAALTEWSRETVADPWLIATAASYNYTIITFEESNTGLSSRTPSKNAKIPDVAQTFGVKTEKLYYMMRELGLKLG